MSEEQLLDVLKVITKQNEQDMADYLDERSAFENPDKQFGYEEWSEPATAENIPAELGIPSDNINDYLSKKSFATQAENEAGFEEFNKLPSSQKELIKNDDYRLNANETTIYRVLEIDSNKALLQRTTEQPIGSDPTPFIIASNPVVSKHGFLSWDSGQYYSELPTDFKLPNIKVLSQNKQKTKKMTMQERLNNARQKIKEQPTQKSKSKGDVEL